MLFSLESKMLVSASSTVHLQQTGIRKRLSAPFFRKPWRIRRAPDKRYLMRLGPQVREGRGEGERDGGGEKVKGPAINEWDKGDVSHKVMDMVVVGWHMCV